MTKERTDGLTRRGVLQAMGAGTAAWAFGQTQAGFNVLRSETAGAMSGPDVYVVVLDDCSPEYIGHYQSILPTAYQGPIHTPELDALFAASWTATSARATVAVCAASRSSFLTGATAAETGLFGEEGFNLTAKINALLAKISAGELVSLPGFLTSQGFDTATRGKVDHTGQLFDLPGQIGEQGTHTSILALFNDPDYAPDGVAGSDASFMPYAVLSDPVQHVDALRVDEQIARINAPYTGQRVDFLGFALPHTPRSVHQSWLDLYDVGDIELRTTPAEIMADQADIPGTHLGYLDTPYYPGGIPRSQWMHDNLTEDGLKAHVRHMLASLSHASFQVGRLKTALDAAARPYVIVVTSDHGYFLAEKGHYAKGTIYDKGLRVPLAIYSSQGSVDYPVGSVDHPITLQALPKTVAQLAGVNPSLVPPQWGGQRFDDTSGGCLEHTWGFDAATQSKGLVWTSGAGNQFKLIVHPGDDGELYNLTTDPGEIDNLLVANAAGASPSSEAERTASRSEAEAALDLRARQDRAAAWRARGKTLADEANT